MKVLLVQPSNSIGGAEMSAFQVMEGLSLTYGVIFFAAITPPIDTHYALMLKKTCSEIITVPLITWNRKKSSSLQSNIMLLLYKLYKGKPILSVCKLLNFIKQNNIDLIYSNSGLCPIGGIVARLSGVPHIWHIREKLGYGNEFPLILGDKFSRKLIDRLSDFVICNSGFTASFFNNEICNLKVVLNGIDTQKFTNESAILRGKELRNQMGITDQSLVIGMVGSLFSSWKEHSIFLEAAKIIKENGINATYLIFGGSKDPRQSEYARSVFQKVIDLGLVGQVLFADMQNDIPAMMKSMDIMMYPTSQEGSGRVIMEAMASKKAVISVNAGGVGELIIDGENGLSVPAKRPDLLAETVLRVIKNENLRLSIEKQAFTYAQKHFELKRTQNEIYEIFEHVFRESK